MVAAKRVSRIGGKREIPVDARIIAASNRNLADEVAAGTFRKDLFYRLNVLPLRVPPLREMKGDLHELLTAFLRDAAAENGTPAKRISDGAMRRLVAYDWPGNVRELRNCVGYLGFTVEEEEILEHHLPPEILQGGSETTGTQVTPGEPGNFDSLERMFLVETMRKFQGNAVEAAKSLGISRSTLYRKLKKHLITG